MTTLREDEHIASAPPRTIYTRASERVTNAALLEALGVAVYMTDAAGVITDYNEAATVLWGRHPVIGTDEWCGSWRLYWPDGSPMAHGECPMAIALKEQRIVRGYEGMAERPDGTRVWFIPYPTPLFDAEGALIGAVNVLVDITDRKSAENELRDRREHLEAVFRSSVAGIAEMDSDGRLRSVNERFCEIMGRTREALLDGVSYADITHPEDRARVRAGVETLAAGDEAFVMEQRCLLPDGGVVWVHNGVSAVRRADGELVSAVAVVTDITELIQTAEALAEANAKKDEFLSLVSHELRTPITTILGNATILASRGNRLNESQRTDALADIKGETERLNRVIEDLLTIARFEHGESVDIHPVQVQRLAERVVEARLKEATSHRYRIELRTELPLAEANELLVEQVLRNLLSNAEKYSSPGTCIDVSFRAEGGQVLLTVEDEGVGVDGRDMDRIFDPFYRSARTANRPGIGVGLSVCRRLAEVMGGSITAESREHEGSRFALSLPAIAGDELE